MSSSLGSSLLWFVVILAAIPLVLWVVKRTPYGQAISGAARSGGGASTRALSSLALGQHQRIVTVEVGQGEERRWLVLGVTLQSITALHTMAPQAEAPAAPAAPTPASLASSFAALLGKARDARR